MDSPIVASPISEDISGSHDADECHGDTLCGPYSVSDSKIRWIFVTCSLVCGAVVAYTTRFFVNGDALTYFDMAEAFEKHQWAELINFHYSPGYPVLLGIANRLFNAGSVDELFLAKAVNLLCYACALAALELLLQQIKADEEFAPCGRLQHIDWLSFRAVAYGLFLVYAIAYIRIQVVSPDMLEFCFLLLAAAVLVWIKNCGDSFTRFVVLGVVAGVGYIFKTPFFLMSFVFFVLASLYASSLSRAVPRVLVAVIVFLAISSSVWLPISNRLGRLSFGESGTFNYTNFVSGSGKRIHVPEKLWQNPHVEICSGESQVATFPLGFDLAYWNEGVKPKFDLRAQVSVLAENLLAVLEVNPYLFLILAIWLCLQVRKGARFVERFRRPTLSVLFGTVSVTGIGLFCLVLVESRYIAPYLFLGLAAVLLLPRYEAENAGALKSARVKVALITTFLIGTTVYSIWDQTSRSLYDQEENPSHRSVLLENVAIKEFLNSRGVSEGDLAGLLGDPSTGLYWARLAGLKANARIPDQQAFLMASPQARAGAVNALRQRRVKVIVGTGKAMRKLKEEGWNVVPGTKSSYALLLQ